MLCGSISSGTREKSLRRWVGGSQAGDDRKEEEDEERKGGRKRTVHARGVCHCGLAVM